ncbi:hypothetical protein RvY_01247 [Ramazzottius varieornatus]|uniref:Cilia- and flagella-associated protein 99 n=1 Tax=Ramazzottius varieornatus TaxID=947166 RepID=A0A1D1UFZ8_RAMVA|nr:hypothetical protein RvY_01247 [Ramazzottius varieornatus]
MAEKLIEIITLSTSILDTFDPAQPISLWQFFREFLKKENKSISVEQQADLLILCENCLRHNKILQSVVSPFAKQTSRITLRKDLQLCKVLTYFTIFQWRLHPLPVVQAVLDHLYSFSIRKFLLFLVGVDQKTNVESQKKPIHNEIKADWYVNFDRDFIEKYVYGPYCEIEEELRRIVLQLEDVYQNGKQKKPRRPTIPQPFGLRTHTRQRAPKQRPISSQLEANASAVEFLANEIPETKYRPSASTVELQAKANERTARTETFRQRIAQRQKQRAAAKSAALEKQARPSRPKVRRAASRLLIEVHREEMEERIGPVTAPEQKPSTLVANPQKEVTRPKKTRPVRQTAAGILREKALFAKHKENNQKIAEELAAGFWNPEEMEKRQRQLEEKDMERMVVENERKIIDAMQTLENAIAARNTYIEETKAKAVWEKEQKKQLQDQRREMMEKEIARSRAAVVEAQLNARSQLGVARKRILEEKQQMALEVKEANNELYQRYVDKNSLSEVSFGFVTYVSLRYLDQCEVEFQRRKEVIAQIQEMEKRISNYERVFDFGEMPQYGNLTDMSLADLQDRLISLRFETIEKLARRKSQIMVEQEATKGILVEARTFIEKARPVWEEQKRHFNDKAKKLKEIREGAHNLPRVEAVRNQILQKSQLRRKQRVAEREALLGRKDSAWDLYVYE